MFWLVSLPQLSHKIIRLHAWIGLTQNTPNFPIRSVTVNGNNQNPVYPVLLKSLIYGYLAMAAPVVLGDDTTIANQLAKASNHRYEFKMWTNSAAIKSMCLNNACCRLLQCMNASEMLIAHVQIEKIFSERHHSGQVLKLVYTSIAYNGMQWCNCMHCGYLCRYAIVMWLHWSWWANWAGEEVGWWPPASCNFWIHRFCCFMILETGSYGNKTMSIATIRLPSKKDAWAHNVWLWDMMTIIWLGRVINNWVILCIGQKLLVVQYYLIHFRVLHSFKSKILWSQFHKSITQLYL